MTEAPSFRDEVSYLQFAIDHHFSALRITELAAGTAAVGSSSNYAGAPDVFAATPAKATNSVALNIATMANMAQRMEIVEGQEFLQTYYGIDYTPSLQPYLAPLLPPLEQAAAGDEFNVAFLQIFTGHHMTLVPSSEQCATAAPNAPVRTYCANIAAAQTREISEQRAELAATYGITNIAFEVIPLPSNIGGTPVPEPASAALFAAGLLGLGLVRSVGAARRRGHRASGALILCPGVVKA